MKKYIINIHLITSLESGGAQKVLYDYLSNIKLRNNDETMVFSLTCDDFYKNKIMELGVKVICLNKISNWILFFRCVFLFPGYFKAWMYHPCVLSLIAKFNPKRSVYWSIHHGRVDFNTDSYSTIIFSRLSAVLSWVIPEKVIFVSNNCLSSHTDIGFKKSNAITIYNYVKSDFLGGYQFKNRYRITFVGRDHPNKNLTLFLNACRILDDIYKGEFKFSILGKDTNLRARVDSFSDNFEFLGEVNNVKSIYQETNIYVCTSYIESFGITIIEAIFNGCKVVCPDSPVFHEITNGHGGCVQFYEQGNVDSLINAIETALSNTNHTTSYMEEIESKYSIFNTINKMKFLLGDD